MGNSFKPPDRQTSGTVQNEREKASGNIVQSTDNTAQPVVEGSSYAGLQTEMEKVSDEDSALPEGEKSICESISGIEGSKDEGENNERAERTCVKKRIAGFRDVVKHLTRGEVEEFENNPFPTNIRIDQTSGIITVEGWQEFVSDVEDTVKRKLQEIQMNKQLNEEAKQLYEHVRWRYQGISGEERHIEDYDELTNFEIEKGYQEGKVSVTLVDVEGVKSVLRFDEMIEHIENHEKDQVKVSRMDLTVKQGESVSTDNLGDQDVQISPTPLENPGVVNADMLSADELLYELSLQESQTASALEHQTEAFIEQAKDTRNLKLEDEYMKSRIESHRDLIVTLTKQEVKELENVQALANIKIDRANGFVTLDGPLRDVSEAERRILTKLRHIRRKRKLDIELRRPNTIVKWFFQEFTTGEFIEYKEHVNIAIEASYRNLNDGIRLYDQKNVAFVIDFVDMVEYIENERTNQVPVVRKVIQSTLDKFQTPPVSFIK